MSTDTDQRTPDVDNSDGTDGSQAVVLPVQRRPAESVARSVDHVRVHGRSCWWDVTECRWQCTAGR